MSSPDVEVSTIRRDRLFVALTEDDPRAAGDSVHIDALRDADVIAHAGHSRSMMSGILSSLCEAAGFVPRIRHEVEERSTLVTLVAAGLGVAVVPEPTSALGIAGVRYLPLAPDVRTVDLAVATVSGVRTPMIDNTLAVLRRII